MLQDVMTPKQVAEFLRLDTETVYRLIRRKQLAAIRIGRTYRIPREDRDELLIANSSRPDVQEALSDRVLSVAERNPSVDGDELLEELEREDDERKRRRAVS